MDANDVLALGLGVRAPWKPVGQRLDKDKQPNELHLGLDETASKRGHNYVTVFIDLDAKQKPLVFVTPGKGKATVPAFKAFLEQHGGKPGHIVEVVCDMSPAFLAAVGETFPEAEVTVDWFHMVQLFTRAVDRVHKAEAKQTRMLNALRWAALKAADRSLTDRQSHALAELEATDLFTATAWRIKEKLHWIRKAESVQAARWRIIAFIRHARDGLAE